LAVAQSSELSRAAREKLLLTSVAQAGLAIDALARRIQDLPGEIRWVYAQQDVIAATAKGVPVRPGVQTARIAWLLKWVGKVGLDLAAAKLASLVLLAALRCRQSRIPRKTGHRCYFVGISALKEAELVPQFEAMCGEPAAVIDQRFSGALASIYPPGIFELLQSWRDAARPVFAALVAEKAGPLDRSAVLTYVVRRLHHYAHFLAVFRGLNASAPETAVGFSSADLPAYAAVRAGIAAVYFQHGFSARSLVYPDFHRVVAFNAPEAKHVQERLPRASVSSSAPDIRPIKVTCRVAIVGDYGDKLARSRDLIEFCRMGGVDVVVRPHPADRSGYWSNWEGISGVRVERGGTFDEFLERHRPCIMATWYSTTIYDALLRGVVPVTFQADQPDIVFPIADVALAWPANHERIRAVLRDRESRYSALTEALTQAFGASSARSAMQIIAEVDQAGELVA
jgi:hypothetical protein